jgi:hypothetical protein
LRIGLPDVRFEEGPGTGQEGQNCEAHVVLSMRQSGGRVDDTNRKNPS